MKLVLASKSPRRRELLSMLNCNFEVRASEADESFDKGTPLINVPKILAERKANATPLYEDEVIIGCDTVVIYKDELMGKPKTDEEAKSMLTALSGTTHMVVSGIAVRTNGKIASTSVITYVKFRELEKSEIDAYVDTAHPTDKAGAYGIQEMAGAFVEKIDGDFYNVVGLPLCRLCQILKESFDISLI